MFLYSNTMRFIHITIGISILLLCFDNSYGMFSTLSRKVQIQSMPITRASYIPRTSIQQPISWLSRIKTSLGTWNARRFYQSLSELLAIKTKEEHEKHIQALQKAGKPLSPTQAHLTYGLAEPAFIQEHRIMKRMLKSLRELNNLNFTQIDEIIKKEKEFFDAGYTILYHGTQPEYYAMHYIDTQCAILNKKLVESQVYSQKIPLILRQRDIHKGQEEKTLREQFIEKGTSDDLYDREFLLSCNPALTSNLSSPGSCTLAYWHNKMSTIKITTDETSDIMQEFIDKYDILGLYVNSYKKELLKYVHDLNENLKSGVLLQVVFKDPKLVEKCVYASAPGGKQRIVCLPEGQTSNIAKIMQVYSKEVPVLTSTDIDQIQYRIVLTSDKLLDVFNKNIYENFEIHAYANPQSALEEFHKEINNIMQKIEQDFYDKEVTARIEREWDEKLKGMYMQKSVAEQLPSSKQEVLKEFNDKLEKEQQLFNTFKE
ncbi:MAG TPA: hypothetical protein VGW78_06960, partial [Candidatus Babeliales bacterium]|nr:hypothetical protein [Candidatus Babeliales bacterium]